MNAVIHMTDLFHPHEDPDDHFDLACQYALAYQAKIKLKGIVIDYPVNDSYGDPAIQAIAQMNYLSCLRVPFAIGSDRRVLQREDAVEESPGVRLLIEVLESSDEKIAIQVAGSCRDLAAAILLRPDLFQNKCKGIYLNAGASKAGSPPEYNVSLDPLSYQRVFDAPCPLYWLPCFEMAAIPFQTGEFASYYQFRQGDVLERLSLQMKNYFIYALKREDRPWLRSLKDEIDPEDIRAISLNKRNMWCTAGILHAAGMTVLRDGRIVSLGDPAAADAVFTFERIGARCHDSGRVNWSCSEEESNRYILHVTAVNDYERAMTLALACLLGNLP